ncbi:hypothetical protein AOH221_03340 [Helicobacter pylori]
MKEQSIIDFLKFRDYDIRKTQSARWIDQKCTPDVLSVVADCILEFTQCSIENHFLLGIFGIALTPMKMLKRFFLNLI